MDKLTQKFYTDATKARKRFKLGKTTYDEAKLRVAPYIDHINILGAKIAQKHHKKFYPFTYIGFLR